MIGLVGGHEVAGRHLPVDLGSEVGERGPQAFVQHPHPVLIGLALSLAWATRRTCRVTADVDRLRIGRSGIPANAAGA